MLVTGFEVTLPAPTVFRVLAGTVRTSRMTLAGREVPVGEPADVEAGGFWPALATLTATTTTRTLPPVISIRLRISARRAAARCGAIFAWAFSRLVLVALLIACPMHGGLAA